MRRVTPLFGGLLLLCCAVLPAASEHWGRGGRKSLLVVQPPSGGGAKAVPVLTVTVRWGVAAAKQARRPGCGTALRSAPARERCLRALTVAGRRRARRSR
jgi:hypothetical protein